MDSDTRNLARQLAAFSTRLIEQAHELSVQGQSPRLNDGSAAVIAAQLKTATADIGVLAAAIEVVVGAQGSDR